MVGENRYQRIICRLPVCNRCRNELAGRIRGQKDWGMVFGVAFGVPVLCCILAALSALSLVCH